MRVAVSGTHCSGKSTLIEEFLVDHTDFAHEPEPYTVLQDDYGEVFAGEPSADDFYRQLAFNVERLRCYASGARVIYERSPVDFLAYLLALNDLQRDKESAGLVERSLALVTDGIKHLDLIVFLPLEDERATVPDSEDRELRSAVDDRLMGILGDDDFKLFPSNCPVVLEARGTTAQRLKMLERALA